MATFDKLPVYKDSYDLLYMVYNGLNNVPRDIKFTLVQSLRQDVITLMENIYLANSSVSKGAYLLKCRECVVAISLKMRLLNDLRHISTKFYALSSLKIEAVSNQLTAWQKYVNSKEPSISSEQ